MLHELKLQPASFFFRPTEVCLCCFSLPWIRQDKIRRAGWLAGLGLSLFLPSTSSSTYGTLSPHWGANESHVPELHRTIGQANHEEGIISFSLALARERASRQDTDSKKASVTRAHRDRFSINVCGHLYCLV